LDGVVEVHYQNFGPNTTRVWEVNISRRTTFGSVVSLLRDDLAENPATEHVALSKYCLEDLRVPERQNLQIRLPSGDITNESAQLFDILGSKPKVVVQLEECPGNVE